MSKRKKKKRKEKKKKEKKERKKKCLIHYLILFGSWNIKVVL